MKFASRLFFKFVFVISILFLQSNFAYALNVCPGVSTTLTWQVTSGTVTSCPIHTADDFACQFQGSNGSKSVTLSAGQSCSVQFQCENNGVYSNTAQDSLTVYSGPDLNTNGCCTSVGKVYDLSTQSCVAPPSAPTATNPSPIGNADNADCNVVTGWTCDGSNWSQQIDVHIYEGRTFVGGTTGRLYKSNFYRASCSVFRFFAGISQPIFSSTQIG